MKGFEFGEDNMIQGDYLKAVREAFPKKKEAGLAMRFVAFRLNMAKEQGKEEALKLESPFDEVECIHSNQSFLFTGLVTIKDIKVMINTSKEAQAFEGAVRAVE